MSEYDIPGPEDPEPSPPQVFARPAPGTGTVTISATRDGWQAVWEDGKGGMLSSPDMTFPDALEWARSKPAPEIHIFTGWWNGKHRLQ